MFDKIFGGRHTVAMAEKQRQQHKYLEVAEHIKKDILDGVYKVGERIPPIRKLSETYGVTPQTVNKATTYLSSMGYLVSRQGAGSTVTIPHMEKQERFIGMLVDQARSNWLTEGENHGSSHSRDIYLSYFMLMNNKSIGADFFVYKKDETSVSQAFQELALKASGFFVQGTLPDCYFEYLSDHNIPAVLINRSVPQGVQGYFGSVLISEAKVYDMLNYLVSLGHTKILFAFSNEFEKNEAFRRRYAHLKAACASWSGDNPVELELFDFDAEGSAVEKHLRTLVDSGFTAAFGYNDVSALRLYPIAHAINLAIPRDFSVVGFDDIIASHLAHPPLTTLKVSRSSLIHEGYTIMEQLMESRSPIYLEKTVKTEMVIRKSVAIAAGN